MLWAFSAYTISFNVSSHTARNLHFLTDFARYLLEDVHERLEVGAEVPGLTHAAFMIGACSDPSIRKFRTSTCLDSGVAARTRAARLGLVTT